MKNEMTIEVGHEHICRDAERHADALRYVDALLIECIAAGLRNPPCNEDESPLSWRLRRGREKLAGAIDSLDRSYMVTVPNA